MRKFLAILLSITVSAAPAIGSAAAAEAPTAAAKTPQEWAAVMGPHSLTAAMSECIDSVKTTGKTTSVTLANGTRVDTVKLADGKTKSISTFNSKGVLVRAVDVVAAPAPERAIVPTYVARDEGYQAMRQIAKDAFLTSLRNKCHAMAVKKAAAVANKGAAHTELLNNPACGGSSGMGDDDGGSPYDDCIEYGGGGGGGSGGGGGASSEDDAAFSNEYVGLIGDLVSDDIAAGENAMDVARRYQPRMKCTVAVAQCQQSCANLAIVMTATCTALAASTALFSAGVLLPVAGATSVMCAGLIYDGLERCREGCNAPAVQCDF